MEIVDLLNYSNQNRASDLHLISDYYPCIRINGDITPLTDTSVLSSDEIKGLIYSVMTDAQRAEYEKNMEIDFAIQFGQDMRFRVNAFNTHKGSSAVFRTIPTDVLTLDNLNLPKVFKKLCSLTKGLVLVTGPTGSGKSTTLAAMIDEINKKYKKHILTVEDPIEFVHKPAKSIINQRELHSSTKSFSNALKSALREDPDIILVGEMRDLETISLALTAAETGHLVFGTLHTTSAAKTIDRVIDVFPASEKELIRSMLSSSIQAVVAQTLLKKKDNTGRVAALEIMLGTPAVRNLIRENKIPQLASMISIGGKHGMISIGDSVKHLLESGQIDPQTAEAALNAVNEASDFDDESNSEVKQDTDNNSSVQNQVADGGNPSKSFFKKNRDERKIEPSLVQNSTPRNSDYDKNDF